MMGDDLIHLRREQIVDMLSQNMRAVAEWYELEHDDRFTFAPEGKWTAGQHLDHLIRSTKPVLLALRLPQFVPRLLFGTANRASATDEAVIAKYRQALHNGGKASGGFVPKQVPMGAKAKLLTHYRMLEQNLSSAAAQYPEEALDTLVLPHPLIGKLTFREMLYFTAYHNAHHLETLKREY